MVPPHWTVTSWPSKAPSCGMGEGLGAALGTRVTGLAVGLDGLRGLFHPKRFCHSMNPSRGAPSAPSTPPEAAEGAGVTGQGSLPLCPCIHLSITSWHTAGTAIVPPSRVTARPQSLHGTIGLSKTCSPGFIGQAPYFAVHSLFPHIISSFP